MKDQLFACSSTGKKKRKKKKTPASLFGSLKKKILKRHIRNRLDIPHLTWKLSINVSFADQPAANWFSDTISYCSSYTKVRMVWEPNYDTLNRLFCLLRNPSTLQTGNCCACQPITVFQKGKEINCNFSGTAIEAVKQTEQNWFCLYFKHWKYVWFFKNRIDEWISKDLVLYCKQIYQNYDHTGNTASLPIPREAQSKTFN